MKRSGSSRLFEAFCNTNYHLIQGADVAYVAFGEKDSSSAQLVGIATDIIVAINGTPIRNNAELLLTLEEYTVGDRVTLRLLRGRTEVEVDVELETAD